MGREIRLTGAAGNLIDLDLRNGNGMVKEREEQKYSSSERVKRLHVNHEGSAERMESCTEDVEGERERVCVCVYVYVYVRG